MSSKAVRVLSVLYPYFCLLIFNASLTVPTMYIVNLHFINVLHVYIYTELKLYCFNVTSCLLTFLCYCNEMTLGMVFQNDAFGCSIYRFVEVNFIHLSIYVFVRGHVKEFVVQYGDVWLHIDGAALICWQNFIRNHFFPGHYHADSFSTEFL